MSAAEVDSAMSAAFARELAPLMAIITELRKTIVELTSRLSRYESVNPNGDSSSFGAQAQASASQQQQQLQAEQSGFRVDFTSTASATHDFGSEQVKSYRAALGRVDQSTTYQAGPYGGTKSKSGSKNQIGASRYDPKHDPRNVAYYRDTLYKDNPGLDPIRNPNAGGKRPLPATGTVNKTAVESSNASSEPITQDINSDNWQLAGKRRRFQQRSPDPVTPVRLSNRTEPASQGVCPVGLVNEFDEHISTDEIMQVDELPVIAPPAQPPNQMGARSRFVTPKADGNMRDVLTIECPKINGLPFRGSITYTEAKYIFSDILRLTPNLVHSIKISFNKCRVITYKLTEQMDMDSLSDTINFNLERAYHSGDEEKIDQIECKIIGIRKPRTTPELPRPHYNGSNDDVQWVEISGCQYSVDSDELKSWLELYGLVLTPITEMKHPEADEDEPVGNGTYIVQMRLMMPIPQYLPISGRKIRIYYNGIKRECTNCYGQHPRQKCHNKKIQWITHVKRFIRENPGINSLWYGKWFDIIHPNGRSENGFEYYSRRQSPFQRTDATYRLRSRSRPAHRSNNPNQQDWSGTQRNQTRNSQNDRNSSRPRRDQSTNRFGQRSWSNTRSGQNPKQTNQENEQAYRDYDVYARDQIARVSKENRQTDSTPSNSDKSSNTVEHYIKRGLTRSEANSFIETLKTQELLRQRMANSNQNQNGSQF